MTILLINFLNTIFVLLKLAVLGALLRGLVVSLTRHVERFDPPEWKCRGWVSAVSTLIWAGLVLFMPPVPSVWIIAGLVLLLLVLAGFKWPSLRNLLPFWRWAVALKHRVRDNTASYMVESRIGLRPELPPTEKRDYRASWHEQSETGTLDFVCKKAGVTDDFVAKKVAAALGAMSAKAYKIASPEPGHWIITFYAEIPPDPLDAVRESHAIDQWNGTDVTIGVDSDDANVIVTYAETSGIVVGGVPGAGKSAGATVLTAPLLASPIAAVHIIDGKGGADWDWARNCADSFTNDDTDLMALADRLETFEYRCLEDLRTHPWSESDPNFWHVGPSALHPFHLIVIDECQTLFDVTGVLDKDEKAAMLRMRRSVMQIVKKGRSAGWCVMLLTQKPTADSIPTAIRDNCSLRVSFRVTTREAATATLGDVPADGLSPLEIPAPRKGGAVVQGSDGRLRMVRFDYLSVQDAAGALADCPKELGLLPVGSGV